MWLKSDKFLGLKVVVEGGYKAGQKGGAEESQQQFVQGLSYLYFNPQRIA